MTPTAGALEVLARRYGVETTYQAPGGGRARVADASLVAVLGALGAPIRRPEDAARVLARPAAGRRVVEPVLVHRGGSRAPHRLALPAGLAPERVRLTVAREDGSVVHRILRDALAGPARPARDGDGAVTEWPFRLTGPLAAPPGYHRLGVEGPGIATSALVVSAPRRLPGADRGWGVFTPLYAVRTGTDWGVGSFGELGELCEWTARLGGSFVGTLPLDAAFLDGPVVDPSPYRPASRLALNELYVDVERLPELELCPRARRLVASPGFVRRLAHLRAGRYSDPGATLAAKRQVMELLADALASSSSPRRAEMAAFLAGRPELEAYARFRAATETLDRPWTQWPQGRPGRVPAGAADERRVRYHRYAQWVADGQLAAAAARGGLYLDLPIGSHPDGFDPWYHPSAFAAGATVGAPPDLFQPAGQEWAVNPLHPERVRTEGYRYQIAALRHVLRHASVVRIDHVMGLHRLWWVPAGMGPTEGAYVAYRADELRAITVLEAARAGVVVVGEDLGTVAPAVRAGLRRDGMLRSHVHQFAATPGDPFCDPPADSMASIGTHDLFPFASWWAGLDVADPARRPPPAGVVDGRAERAALRSAVAASLGGPASPGGALRAVLAHLAAGPAQLVQVDLEDLWGEREPQNRPGSGPEAANFTRRWARRWPEDVTARGPAAVLRLVDAARRGPRVPPPAPGAGDSPRRSTRRPRKGDGR